MSVKNREIDENGYVIIEPLIQVDIDLKKSGLEKIQQVLPQGILQEVFECQS